MNAMSLPDIAAQNSPLHQPLDWVGMQGIALPVLLQGMPLAGRCDAGVSLEDCTARGIHMSRLYLALEALENRELQPGSLRHVLQLFLDSHTGLSERAFLDLSGELLLKRPALVSPLAGWKAYPLRLLARLDGHGFHVELRLEVGYSSTCPCSAALARQLIQARFREDFTGQVLEHAAVLEWLGSSEGILATPHSQRSVARLHLHLDAGLAQVPVREIIDRAEQALGTALQTAVKRADEQAFALANGQNLMFCEDAARRLHTGFAGAQGIAAFSLEVVHAESLHAHDAVARSRWSRAGD